MILSHYLTLPFSSSTIHQMKKNKIIIILLTLALSPRIILASELPSDMVRINPGCFIMGTKDNYLYEDDDDLADWMAQQDVFQEPEDDIEPEATEEVIG